VAATLISLIVAVAEKCHPAETINGDMWASFAAGPNEHRVAVIDGAGHGLEAARAASAARDEILRHPGLPLDEVLRRCHSALKGSRGAVMTLISIQLDTLILTAAGIGNIESQVFSGGKTTHLVTQRGMLGANVPTVRPTVAELNGSWLLVMHSDGVRARFSLADAVPLSGNSIAPQALADSILNDYGRGDDDATVLVVSPQRLGTSPR